eukprot:CAMPEP_0172172184 /NCGR_PEP_ID=MMETSP1050-20130122/12301_1 /TAXON_ID=233186 /ORGANISM="Cryptomonas curvata, Strain CCAP979/52" /LENGTH=308 /DNA_ID=CAMNT_0012843687 /DNA_START=366 /DNA_END=1294 /DNA_ORIENTATION=-
MMNADKSVTLLWRCWARPNLGGSWVHDDPGPERARTHSDSRLAGRRRRRPSPALPSQASTPLCSLNLTGTAARPRQARIWSDSADSESESESLGSERRDINCCCACCPVAARLATLSSESCCHSAAWLSRILPVATAALVTGRETQHWQGSGAGMPAVKGRDSDSEPWLPGYYRRDTVTGHCEFEYQSVRDPGGTVAGYVARAALLSGPVATESAHRPAWGGGRDPSIDATAAAANLPVTILAPQDVAAGRCVTRWAMASWHRAKSQKLQVACFWDLNHLGKFHAVGAYVGMGIGGEWEVPLQIHRPQ